MTDSLPELDFDRSPHTGWTRGHHVAFCEELLRGFIQQVDRETGDFSLPEAWRESYVQQKADKYYAGIHFPEDAFLSEAWERALVGLACYFKGTGRVSLLGSEEDLAALFRVRIARGCDPEDALYFGEPPPHGVRGCLLAHALLIAPACLLDPMDEATRTQVLSWLAGTLPRESYDNNHYYFHLQVVPLLARYDFPYDEALADMRWERCLGFYAGGGWFQDGSSLSFDYYNQWGFQYYLMNLIHYHAPWRERYGERVAEISRQFYTDYAKFFAEDGVHVPYGRSLSYRFGSVDSLPWALQSGVAAWPHSAGMARRMVSGSFKYFREQGCLNEDGFLIGGFHASNAALLEPYSSVASAYWAMTSFAHLLLPEDDAFWTEVEAELPPAGVTPLAGPQWLINRTAHGNVKLYPIRSPRPDWPGWQIPTKYYGHVYDTAIGFAVDPEGDHLANRLAVSVDNGETWHAREQPLAHALNQRRGRSVLTMPFGVVTTEVVVLPEGELLVVCNQSEHDWRVRLGGYALQVPHGETFSQEEAEASHELRTPTMSSTLALLSPAVGATWQATALGVRAGYDHAHLFGGTSVWSEVTTEVVQPTQCLIFYQHARAKPDATWSLPEIEVLNLGNDHSHHFAFSVDGERVELRQ